MYRWCSAKRGISHIVARDRFAASSGSGAVPSSSNSARSCWRCRLTPFAIEWFVHSGEPQSTCVRGK